MKQINLFVSTKVRLTAVPHIVDVLGQYVGGRPLGKPSSAVGGGECYVLWLAVGLILICIRFSVLPALSLNEGVLHCDIIEGAFDTASFRTFIERTLDRMQPFPAPNSVIVMDNCRIHKHPSIVELIESRYGIFIPKQLVLPFIHI
jgi:hypothetical protein